MQLDEVTIDDDRFGGDDQAKLNALLEALGADAAHIEIQARSDIPTGKMEIHAIKVSDDAPDRKQLQARVEMKLGGQGSPDRPR